jgi:hypothetical protein
VGFVGKLHQYRKSFDDLVKGFSTKTPAATEVDDMSWRLMPPSFFSLLSPLTKSSASFLRGLLVSLTVNLTMRPLSEQAA